MFEYRVYKIDEVKLHAWVHYGDNGFSVFSIAIEATSDHRIPGDDPVWGDFCVVSHSIAKEPRVYHNTEFFACLPAGAYRAVNDLCSTNSKHAWEDFESYLAREWGYNAAKHGRFYQVVAHQDAMLENQPEPIDLYQQANLDADLLMKLDEVEATLTRLESERNALDVSYHAAVGQWRTVNAAISPARRRRV